MDLKIFSNSKKPIGTQAVVVSDAAVIALTTFTSAGNYCIKINFFNSNGFFKLMYSNRFVIRRVLL